jgi:hypothetical protein
MHKALMGQRESAMSESKQMFTVLLLMFVLAQYIILQKDIVRYLQIWYRKKIRCSILTNKKWMQLSYSFFNLTHIKSEALHLLV